MGSSARRVLFVFSVWPEPSSSAAGVRDCQLVVAFQRHGWDVCASSPAVNHHFRESLEELGARTYQTPPNDSAFDSMLLEVRPEVVVFDRFIMEEQFGWRVREILPECLRVLDTQDLHFVRMERQERAESTASGESERVRLRELAAIHRSDLALIISTAEIELLTREWRVDLERLLWIPYMYELSDRENAESRGVEHRDYSGRHGIVFIGNWRHPPNLDGMRWFLREVWPLALELEPSLELDLYGAYPSAEVMQWARLPSVRVHGPAPEVSEAFAKARVNVAPLRFGAGLKGKIVEGWLQGVPCVATPIAAEGLAGGSLRGVGDSEAFGGLIAESATDLAAAIVRLNREQDLWVRAVQRGQEILRGEMEFQAVSSRLMQTIEAVLRDRTQWRRRNWLGEVLWTEAHQRTKYFSRWIEAKETSRLH